MSDDLSSLPPSSDPPASDATPQPEPVETPPSPSAKPRRRSFWPLLVVLAVLVILLAAAALAVPRYGGPYLFRTLSRQYKDPRTMQVAGHYTIEVSLGKMGLNEHVDEQIKVAYEKPNKVRMEQSGTFGCTMVSDGQSLRILTDMNPKKVVTLPMTGTFEELGAKIVGDMGPEAQKALAKGGAGGMFDSKNVKAVHRGVWSRKPWLKTLTAPRGTVAVTVVTTSGPSLVMWFDPWHRVPRQLAMDMDGPELGQLLAEQKSEDMQPVLDMLKTVEIKMVVHYDSMTVDRALPADSFTWQPPADTTVKEVKAVKDLMPALMGIDAEALAAAQPEEKKLTGQAPIDFTAVDLDGKSVKLSSFKGKPVVLDFWATWCPPCRRELPLLNELQTQFKGLTVIAVSTDAKVETVKEFLTKTPLQGKVLWLDPRSEAGRAVDKAYAITGIPRTLYIGKDWVIADDETGLHEKDEMLQSLAKLGLKASL